MTSATIHITGIFPFTFFQQTTNRVWFDNNQERGYFIIALEYYYNTTRDLTVWYKNHPQNKLNQITVAVTHSKKGKTTVKKYNCKLHSLKIRDDGLIKVVLYERTK